VIIGGASIASAMVLYCLLEEYDKTERLFMCFREDNVGKETGIILISCREKEWWI
jgi:hypothetical protein